MLRIFGILIVAVLIIGAGAAIYLGPSKMGELAESMRSGETDQKSAEAPPAREETPAPAAQTGPTPQEPLFDSLGDATWPVTTDSELAQKYFNQGVRWAWAFNHSGAQRAFQEAQRQDPNCAMCYWGEAFVLGPNTNAAMEAKNNAPALAALENALRVAGNASPKERALVEALAKRHSPAPKAERKQLDIAYANAMRAAHQAHPDDQNIAVLYVDSVMNLGPWDYWEADGVTPKGEIGDAIAAAEKVLAANPDHPGAIHLYIHLVEASNTPERALPHAERLAELMPGAGHLIHMGAHIFYRVGRFQDSADLNKKAVEADDLYFKKIDDTASAWRQGYHTHNVHFVVVSSFMTGDKVTAFEYLDRLKDTVSADSAKKVGWMQLIKQAPFVINAHLSEPDVVLAMPDPGDDLPFVQATWNYAQGVAHARKNQLDEARAAAARIKSLEERDDVAYPEDIKPVVKGVLQIAQAVIAARVAEAESNWQEAAKNYRNAIEIQDALPYLEPPYWYYPVRQSLGAALIRAGDPAAAKQVFEEALGRLPNNGWALYGLMQAQQTLGDEAGAEATKQRLAAAWAGDPNALDLSRL